MTLPEIERTLAELASAFAQYVRTNTELSSRVDAKIRELELELAALKISKEGEQWRFGR